MAVELHDCLILFAESCCVLLPLAMLSVNSVQQLDCPQADRADHLLLWVTDREWSMECMGGWMCRIGWPER